jgi:hypothetical protein
MNLKKNTKIELEQVINEELNQPITKGFHGETIDDK